MTDYRSFNLYYYYISYSYMLNSIESLMNKMAKFGVVSRDAVKHFNESLRRLMGINLVRKVFKKGRVYFEFTKEALPLLENYRKELLARLEKLRLVFPRKKVFSTLLSDLRFLDESEPLAGEFRFLGDWQLKEPVVRSQLELAKLKYFDELKSNDG